MRAVTGGVKATNELNNDLCGFRSARQSQPTPASQPIYACATGANSKAAVCIAVCASRALY